MSNQKPLSGEFAGIVEPFVYNGQLAGAVMIAANRERILAVDVVGSADVAGKKQMQDDSLHWIASQTKPITGTAAMMLIEEGKISLDDPVSKWLPEFKTMWVAVEKDEQHVLLKPAHRPITVRDALSHTSGLPFSTWVEHPTLDMLTLRTGARSYASTPLDAEPGARYAYSNAGINIAGLIIEMVSGMPYEDFLDKRLFEPLGMTDTTFWPTGGQLDRIAKSYEVDAGTKKLKEVQIGQLHYPLDDRRRQPMPAGGLFSTAADCVRFCQMVMNGGEWGGRRYLSPESVAIMTAKQTPENLPEKYGLGWGGGDGYGHGGAFNTVMWIYPDDDLAYAFLLQQSGNGEEVGKCRNAYAEAIRKRFGKAAR